jgi:hypothetical protein
VFSERLFMMGARLPLTRHQIKPKYADLFISH